MSPPTSPGGSPRICLVAGPSGSGKTTLVERLVPVLAARGVACATVKHHRGAVETDRRGKDTWRHRQAGARATFLVTDRELIMWAERPADLDLAQLVALCPPGVRLLLVEGFKGLTGYPRVEVARAALDRTVHYSEDVLCVATDVPALEAPCPVVDLDDVGGVAAVLMEALHLDG